MLRYIRVDPQKLKKIRRNGLEKQKSYTLLTKASRPGKAILVIDPSRVNGTGQIPQDAILNLSPRYLRPREVIAGGGYVVRPGKKEPKVLLIFRQGKWDLPKGKQDPGETIEECAAREVCEEIGVASVDVLQNLGTTLHTYPQKDRFYIKHTYWYLMTTSAKTFAPEKREGIEKVKWVRWSKAKKRIGYQTLQDHMEQVEPIVFKAVKKLG